MGSAEDETEHDNPRRYNINDNPDLLAEILARLDGRSLTASASVCRLWRDVSSRDTVWEALCSRQVAVNFTGTRTVVAALGGYRRLYCRCVGPIVNRLAASNEAATTVAVAEARLSLSLSLFSIDCYERLGGGDRQRPSSLLFLRSPVDVSCWCRIRMERARDI